MRSQLSNYEEGKMLYVPFQKKKSSMCCVDLPFMSWHLKVTVVALRPHPRGYRLLVFEVVAVAGGTDEVMPPRPATVSKR